MSRIPKYQAWHKHLKEMFEVAAIQFREPSFVVKKSVSGVNLETWTLDEVELREFTGLTDRHGKEVYEGDICTVEDGMVYSSTAHRMVEGHYQVYWNDDRWGLRHGEFEDYDNGDYYRGDEIHWEECEIIGNIYENGDLLNDKN